jgi:FkbM family methyltransferase
MFKKLLRSVIIKYFELIPFSKGKDRLFSLAKKRKIFDEPFVFRFRKRIRMYIDTSDFIQINLFFHRYYEKPETLVWLELSKEMGTILDIGANVGYYSLLAARNSRAKVYSFEPISSTFEKLERNKRLNKFANINPFRYVVSDKLGMVKIYLGDQLNRGMSSMIKGELLSDEFEEVEAIVLDEFCQRHSIDKVDLVKIDVEGSEMLVLGGMNKILDVSRPLIMIEVDKETQAKFGYSIYDIYNILGKKGYKPYRILENKEIQKIHEPEEQMGLVLFVHHGVKLPSSIKIND